MLFFEENDKKWRLKIKLTAYDRLSVSILQYQDFKLYCEFNFGSTEHKYQNLK